MWRRLRIETLESKRLLAADITATYDAVANKLTIVGTNAVNSLVVRADEAGDIELEAISGSEIAGDTSAPRGADLDIRLYKGDDFLLIDDMGFDDCDGCGGELAGTIVFRGGDGADVVDIVSVTANTLDIATNLGADEVTFGVSPEPAGAVNADVVANEVIIATGSEDDTVSIFSLEAVGVDIRTHEGNDTVIVDAAPLPGGTLNAQVALEIDTSSGVDEILVDAITAGLLDINSGDDIDEISLGSQDGAPTDVSAADIQVQSGAGGDFVFVANLTSDNGPAIRTSSGDDRVWVGAGVLSAQISTAAGEDLVIVLPAASSSLDLMVFLGGNSDEIQLLSTPSVDSFFQGAGHYDTICAESAAVLATLGYAGFEQICFPEPE